VNASVGVTAYGSPPGVHALEAEAGHVSRPVRAGSAAARRPGTRSAPAARSGRRPRPASAAGPRRPARSTRRSGPDKSPAVRRPVT
jgi:hypothetical protein